MGMVITLATAFEGDLNFHGLTELNWWAGGDSNPQPLRDMVLSHARMPFRHLPIDFLMIFCYN